ncbi:TD and POZ domain-containing protein 2 [Panicum miliaceum]|uniref:TD and POZ domain-containing protein 2 n=1 Tax=Panicum miliaceum TaxID=4540 RepID=A0A3L6RFU5_PANMI|nr:TD and POZ domain-containing protein 2 [Panicum miliaceum]
MTHQMPSSKTVSTCAPHREQGTHLFHILGYSQHRAAGASGCIMSDEFPVGGHDWILLFYPDGDGTLGKDASGSNRDCVVAALSLVHKNTKVQASLELRLLDQGTGPSLSVHKEVSRVFDANKHSSPAAAAAAAAPGSLATFRRFHPPPLFLLPVLSQR